MSKNLPNRLPRKPMPTLTFLFDANGREIPNPPMIPASVSWTTRDGIAQAFDPHGKRIAELRNARIEWIEAGGIRITGMEPMNPAGTSFRIQAWQYRP